MKRRSVDNWLKYITAVTAILSVFYLGYSVQQNTEAQLSSSDYELLQLSAEIDSWIYQYPEFAKTLLSVENHEDNLTKAQRRLYEQYLINNLNTWEAAYFNKQRGFMSEEIWQSWNRSFIPLLSNKMAREVWRNSKAYYSATFRAYVDSLLE